MHGTPVMLAAVTWLLLANAAAACDAFSSVDQSPLETRKPVHGEEVHLVAGFGMRLHPLLNLPRMHTGIDWGPRSVRP